MSKHFERGEGEPSTRGRRAALGVAAATALVAATAACGTVRSAVNTERSIAAPLGASTSEPTTANATIDCSYYFNPETGKVSLGTHREVTYYADPTEKPPFTFAGLTEVKYGDFDVKEENGRQVITDTKYSGKKYVYVIEKYTGLLATTSYARGQLTLTNPNMPPTSTWDNLLYFPYVPQDRGYGTPFYTIAAGPTANIVATMPLSPKSETKLPRTNSDVTVRCDLPTYSNSGSAVSRVKVPPQQVTYPNVVEQLPAEQQFGDMFAPRP